MTPEVEGLRFDRRHWGRVLPPELVEAQSDARDGDFQKWQEVPDKFLPKALLAARTAFWSAFREGEDTTNLDSWGLGASAAKFLALVARDPSAVVVLLCVPRTAEESMGRFYGVLLKESSRVLSEPNVMDDALQNKLVESKAKIFGNFKGHVDAFLKMRAASEAQAPRALAAPDGKGALRPDEEDPSEDDPGEGVLPSDPVEAEVPVDK